MRGRWVGLRVGVSCIFGRSGLFVSAVIQREEKEVLTPQMGIWPSATFLEVCSAEAAVAVLGVGDWVVVGVDNGVVELTMSVVSVKMIVFVDVL